MRLSDDPASVWFREACRGTCCLLLLVLVVASAVGGLLAAEWNLFTTTEDYASVKDRILEGHPGDILGGRVPQNSVVHLSGPVQVSSPAEDVAFGVQVEGALALQRHVEYCQWREHATEVCRTCERTLTASDGSRKRETYSCDCVRRYTYVKGWHSHRIPSFGFDQPAAHHNPSRDPYPAAIFHAAAASIGGVPLAPRLISRLRQSNPRTLMWTSDGLRPRGMFEFLRPLCDSLGFYDTTRYERVQELRATLQAPALRDEGFHYLSANGYFFSPYDPPMRAKYFGWFVGYLEGSLFDWQLGDLVPACQAGDIRVWYEVVDPPSASAVASLSGSGALDLYVAASGRQLGLLHPRQVSVADMFAADLWDLRLQAWGARAWAGLPALLVANLLAALLGHQHWPGRFPGWLILPASMTLSLLGLFVAAVWARLGVAGPRAPLLAGASVVVLAAALVGLGTRRASWGPRAAWCWLAQLCGMPPSWRVEASYAKEEASDTKEE